MTASTWDFSKSLRELRNKAGRTRRILFRPRLSTRRRRELLTVEFALATRRRLRRGRELSADIEAGARRGTVFFGRDSFAIDRRAFFGIFLSGWYDTDYSEATVIDVGAHKGYYGTFALVAGARVVISCEPEVRNFEFLEQTAASFRGTASWDVRQVAVSAEDGEGILHESPASDSHSLVLRKRNATVGTQRVQLVSFASLVDEALDQPNDGPVIAKIDAEGTECDIVMRTQDRIWQRVDEVFIEWHAFSPCRSDQLDDRLGQVGLHLSQRTGGTEMQLLRYRRSAAA